MAAVVKVIGRMGVSVLGIDVPRQGAPLCLEFRVSLGVGQGPGYFPKDGTIAFMETPAATIRAGVRVFDSADNAEIGFWIYRAIAVLFVFTPRRPAHRLPPLRQNRRGLASEG